MSFYFHHQKELKMCHLQLMFIMLCAAADINRNEKNKEMLGRITNVIGNKCVTYF